MARTTNLPSTAQGLRSWLKGSTEGRALLRELTEEAIEERLEAKCRACESIRPYPKVLVVLRRLGRFPGVEVYTEEGVSLRFLELPDIPATAKAEILAEEYIELMLSKNWRRLMDLPARRIHRTLFRGISLTEWLRYAELGEAIEEIRTMTLSENQNEKG